jgi:NTE family protein
MFPATRIEYEYFGDGAIRQLAPLSPALHLGADRLFIIGVSANRERPQAATPAGPLHSPSVAQIIGHLLNSAFIDSLESDIERLDRINSLVASGSDGGEASGAAALRYIERLVIAPTEELDVIAAECITSLPASLRFLLRATGGTESGGGGSTAASYLLFARPFVERLIALGFHDAMKEQAKILRFLGHS